MKRMLTHAGYLGTAVLLIAASCFSLFRLGVLTVREATGQPSQWDIATGLCVAAAVAVVVAALILMRWYRDYLAPEEEPYEPPGPYAG